MRQKKRPQESLQRKKLPESLQKELPESLQKRKLPESPLSKRPKE